MGSPFSNIRQCVGAKPTFKENNKLTVTRSVKKRIVLGEQQEVIHLELRINDTTIHGKHMSNLKRRNLRARPHLKVSDMLLKHDNTLHYLKILQADIET